MTAIIDRLRDSKNSVPLRPQKVLTAINSPRRRAVLIEVDDRDTPVTLSELAETIAAAENDKHPHKLTSRERKRVYVSLYQEHLRTLRDIGGISYDEDAGEVGMSNATAPLAELIREIEDRCLSVGPESDN